MTLWIIITIEGPSGVQVEEKWLRYTSKGAFIRHYKKILSIISENVPLKIKNDNKTWKKQKT